MDGAPPPAQREDALRGGEKRALELVAKDAPLNDVLDFLTRLIESQADEMFCSICLVENGRLLIAAAPHLPNGFKRAVDGMAIDPSLGGCSTAASMRDSVVVLDTSRSSTPAAHLAFSHGIRALWSTPIVSTNGNVLGTFGMYYTRPHAPKRTDLRLVEVATHIAGIAIERHLARQALRQHTQALEQADRRKDEFLALLGHELRNPLAPIMTAVELMQLKSEDERAVESQRQIVERQVRHLVRLVDDLLDVSRITHGKIELRREPVDVRDLVARALETVRPHMEQRGHEVLLCLPESPLRLYVDPVRMAQVLSNLLHNAAKYTKRGGRISLSVAVAGDEVRIAVKDSGVGIRSDLLPRVFDAFEQGTWTPDRVRGGLGVGLTLAKKLVELHGGAISATSKGEGMGSEFVVRLPSRAIRPAPTRGQATTDRAAPIMVQRVLVVDDNEDAAETLAAILRHVGNDVRIAHDGLSALQWAKRWHPSAILLDIGLPGIDGYEVARRLRAECPKSMRVIALTGHAQDVDRRRARQAGFDAHLVKPVDLEHLREALVA